MGRRRLILRPLGDSPDFLAPAIDGAAEDLRRGLAFVLPNRSALEHVRNEAARRLGAVDPGRFFTMLGLARKILGHGPGATEDLATPRQRDHALESALEKLASSDDDVAAHAIASGRRFRGFRRGLLSLFAELEASGADEAALADALAKLSRAAPRPDSARRAGLARAFGAYREVLASRELVVEGDLLASAARALARGREYAAPPELVLVAGFLDFSPLQLELLDALAERAVETRIEWPADEPLGRRRAQLEALGFAPERAPAIAHDDRPASLVAIARGVVGGGAPSPDAAAVRVVRAGSPVDEADVIARRARRAVLDEGHAWNDVLVVVPDARGSRDALERACARLDVPVRVHAPRPLTGSPLARGALAFVRAAATLEPAPLLAAADCPALGLSPDEAERLSREVRRRGEPRGDAGFASLGERSPPGARAFIEAVRELGRALGAASNAGEAIRAARRALEARLSLPSLAGVGESGDANAADETAASDALLRLLDELAPLLASATLAPRELALRIEEEAREEEYVPRDRRRRVVHVVDVRDARSWSAPIVIVAGLVEGQFPRPPRDDPFLDDDARALVSGERGKGKKKRALRLLTGRERAADERILFIIAATRARRELWLTHTGFDERGEALPPSPLLVEIERLFEPTAWAAARTERTPANAADPIEIATPADARRLAYRHVAARYRPGDAASEGRARLGAALFRAITDEPAESERAAVARARPTWSLAPGPAQPGDREWALGRVYSASELEDYASCPFKHFVRHVLGVRPREDLGVTGLDSRRRGKIVHSALERAVGIAAGQTVDPGEAFDRAFAEQTRDLAIGPDEEAFRRSARAAVIAFVREDDAWFLARLGLRPAASEISFGPDSPVGALEVHDPELGGTIRLEGRIDRIDERPEGAFVTDYKLGREEVDEAAREAMIRGTKLQLPTYLLAVRRVFGRTPLGAALAALEARRRTGIVGAPGLGLRDERVALVPVDMEGLLRLAEEAIRAIVREIAQGSIDAAPRDARDCRRCDARDICRLEPWRAREKSRARHLPVLAPRQLA